MTQALTVGAILERAHVPIDAVQEACPRIDPAAVLVRIAPFWLRWMSGRGVAGMSLPWGVYLWPSVLDESVDVVAALLCHELVHADQWREFGIRRFVTSYVGGYLRSRLRGVPHGAAYRGLDLEQDAWERAQAMMVRRA